MWIVHSNALHCHGGGRDCRPILTMGIRQLLDNVQNKPSWIKALQESGCSSNEDSLISIHSAFTTTTWSLRLNRGFLPSPKLSLQIPQKKCIGEDRITVFQSVSLTENNYFLNKSLCVICQEIMENLSWFKHLKMWKLKKKKKLANFLRFILLHHDYFGRFGRKKFRLYFYGHFWLFWPFGS